MTKITTIKRQIKAPGVQPIVKAYEFAIENRSESNIVFIDNLGLSIPPGGNRLFANIPGTYRYQDLQISFSDDNPNCHLLITTDYDEP